MIWRRCRTWLTCIFTTCAIRLSSALDARGLNPFGGLDIRLKRQTGKWWGAAPASLLARVGQPRSSYEQEVQLCGGPRLFWKASGLENMARRQSLARGCSGACAAI